MLGLQFSAYCAPTMEQALADTAAEDAPYNLVGTPETIGEHVERIRDLAGLDLFQYRPSIGALSFSQGMASLELLATRVLPYFAQQPATATQPS